MTPEERFWAKVNRTDGPSECWLWTGYLRPNGYAQLVANGRYVYIHRFAYELLIAPIPAGLHVDHRCWVRHCVNPQHLRLVTHAENHQNRRGASAASTTGIRGVFFETRTGKYFVKATRLGVHHYGGSYSTLEEAERAAIALRCRVMTHNDADRRPA